MNAYQIVMLTMSVAILVPMILFLVQFRPPPRPSYGDAFWIGVKSRVQSLVIALLAVRSIFSLLTNPPRSRSTADMTVVLSLTALIMFGAWVQYLIFLRVRKKRKKRLRASPE